MQCSTNRIKEHFYASTISNYKQMIDWMVTEVERCSGLHIVQVLMQQIQEEKHCKCTVQSTHQVEVVTLFILEDNVTQQTISTESYMSQVTQHFILQGRLHIIAISVIISKCGH